MAESGRLRQITPDLGKYARFCQIHQYLQKAKAQKFILDSKFARSGCRISLISRSGNGILITLLTCALLLFSSVPDWARFWLILAKSYLIRHNSGIPSSRSPSACFRCIRTPGDASQASIIPHLNHSFYPHAHLFSCIYFSTKVNGGTEPSHSCVW